MNDVRFLRHSTLRGMSCIGRGTFASVFAPATDSSTVVKVTSDWMSYCCTADRLWEEVREPVQAHFPAVIEDHGDVGESGGATVYVVEVERLRPISTTENRRHIRGWMKAYDDLVMHPPQEFRLRYNEVDTTRLSIYFCEEMAKSSDPYAKVFEAMIYFFSNYGGAFDLRYANFMERPGTGALVFNDVVCDYKDMYRRSKAKYQVHRFH